MTPEMIGGVWVPRELGEPLELIPERGGGFATGGAPELSF